jgi:hypothetical protein
MKLMGDVSEEKPSLLNFRYSIPSYEFSFEKFSINSLVSFPSSLRLALIQFQSSLETRRIKAQTFFFYSWHNPL